MSPLRASALVLGAVSLGLGVMAAPTAAAPTKPVQPSAAVRQVSSASGAGRIAFVNYPDRNIYVMDAEGRHARRLTTDHPGSMGTRVNPTWSPDGRWIAFTDEVDFVVRVVSADTGRPRGIPVTGWAPSWSPDGQRIAYTALDGDAWEVFVMDADGSDRQQLTHVRGFRTISAWSPDGRWIAVMTDDLFLIRPDGTGLKRLSQGVFSQAAAWSPDGRHMVVMKQDGVYVVDRRDGREHRISPRCWDSSPPVWSPNGRLMASQWTGCDAEGKTFLLVTRADGTVLHRFKNRGGPVWSPDGRRILFDARLGIRVMDVDGRHARTLRHTPGDVQAAWFGPAPTRTTVNAAPEPVAKGARLTVTGTLTKSGIPLAAARVRIRFKQTGAHRFTTVRTLTTGPAGRYHATVTASKTGTWKAVHPATAATASSCATDRVKVER